MRFGRPGFAVHGTHPYLHHSFSTIQGYPRSLAKGGMLGLWILIYIF